MDIDESERRSGPASSQDVRRICEHIERVSQEVQQVRGEVQIQGRLARESYKTAGAFVAAIVANIVGLAAAKTMGWF